MRKLLIAAVLALCAGRTQAATPTYANNGVSCSNSQNAQTITSYTCRLPNVTGSGNALIAFAQWGTTSVTGTVSDDKSNTWTQNVCVSGNQKVCGYFALNVASGTRVLTLTLSAATTFVSLAAYEFYNVATSSATDGTCTASGSGTSVACGSAITTTVASDLILFGAVQDTSGATITSWTAGASPWQMRTADDLDSFAMEYQVQTSAGSITPSMTMSPTDHFDGVAMALKSAAAGTAPAAGIRLAYIQHNAFPANSTNPRTWSIQFPCAGNLIVDAWIGVQAYDITSITDGNSNTHTQIGSAFNNSGSGDLQFFHADNATCTSGMSLTVHTTSTDISGSTLELLDVVGAAAAPFDATAGRVNCSGNQTVAGNLTGCTITPSTASGLVLSELGVASNTVNGDSPGNFLSAIPSPISSPDHTDQNNGWNINYNASATAETDTWTQQGGAFGNWASSVVAFEAPPSSTPGAGLGKRKKLEQLDP